jgi:ABC-2 type transport system ATP-binding protein
MSKYAIETTNLSRVFDGDKIAVDNLNLKIEKGTVFGLLGRNGCGKTTSLKMIMGLLCSSTGSATILGHNMFAAPYELRQKIAYVSQNQQLHDWMSVEELCYYVSHFYKKWDQNYADDLISKFGLEKDISIGLMSGGEQRKVALLLALACQPEVLILDEPAAGLDPISRRELIDSLVDLLTRADGCTIILSTHILSDLERIADVIGVMKSGSLTFCESLETIQSSFRKIQLIFNDGEIPENLSIPGVLKKDIQGPVISALVKISNEADLDQFREDPNVRFLEHPVGLEEAFVKYLGEDI